MGTDIDIEEKTSEASLAIAYDIDFTQGGDLEPDDEDELRDIYLLDIEKPEYENILVKTELMIAGIGETYGVPSVYRLSCGNVDKCKDRCPLRTRNNKILHVSKTNRSILSLYKQNDSQLFSLLKKKARTCNEAQIEVIGRYSLQEYLAVPKSTRQTVSKAHKSVLVYHVGNVEREDGYYTVTGRVVTEPMRQKKTLLIKNMIHQQEDWQNFIITDEIKEKFREFQPENSVKEKIWDMAEDVTCNITRIFGEHRMRVTIAELLAMHSPLYYRFDKQEKQGWMGILIVGDTGQGKTTITKNILKGLDIGYFIDGALANRAGLLYSLDEKIAGRRFLRWGAFPLAHGQVIAVDEAHKISKNDWSQLTQVRSSGEVTVNKSVRSMRPAQVRQIFIANPPNNSLSNHTFGIETVKNMMRYEDIRRFDLVCLMSNSDQNADEINLLLSERVLLPQIFTPELLRASIFWAWNLKPEQILWADGAEKKVLELSKSLTQRYGLAEDIPLLLASDTKDKVSKIAVAAAILVHSTVDHETLIVTTDHVDFAGSFIAEMYGHKNCRLDEYVKRVTSKSQLTDDCYDRIKNAFKQMRSSSLDGKTADIIFDIFRASEIVTRVELMRATGLSGPTITKRMTVLSDLGLIGANSRKYVRTPIFVEYFHRLEHEEELNGVY